MESVNEGIKLNESIDLSELMKDGCTFSINLDEASQEEETLYDEGFKNSPEYIELCDHESYASLESFESIKDLVDLTPDGKVRKKILRAGYGSEPESGSLVTLQYHAFFEYADEPFDSTYTRNKPFKFYIDRGDVLPGLNIGVKSMKMNERAQILVHYDYAYGKMGCFERIPAESMILYEVELKDILNIGMTLTYDCLEKEDKQKFENAYDFALQACTKANNLMKQNLAKQAIVEYNKGVAALQYAKLRDMEDQEKQQELLLRLLTNKIIAHNKRNEFKLACASCNEIYNMVKGTCLSVEAKVYYNNAKALINLNDLVTAERRLKLAQKKCPKNQDIANLFIKLDKLKQEERENMVKLSKKILGLGDKNKPETSGEALKSFENVIEENCKELCADQALNKLTFTTKFSEDEKKCMKSLVEKFNLLYVEEVEDGQQKIHIKKGK